MITVESAAQHFALRPDTVRRKIRAGEMPAIRIGRIYRLTWPDIWACEDGPMPKGARMVLYQENLMSKQAIADALSVSVRTVDRWIFNGLPTRNVFGSIRCNPYDVTDWQKLQAVNLPQGWWR